MTYELILWDFDGTVANTATDVWQSVLYAADYCGGTLPEEYVANAANLGLDLNTIFKQIIPSVDMKSFDTFERLVSKHYREISNYENTDLYSGIPKLLADLKKQGFTNYIITNKPIVALERILDVKDWSKYFDGWTTPDSRDGKMLSKTEMISSVLTLFGKSTRNCIYVGDTWSDIRAATANGIDSIGVTYGDGDPVQLAKESPTYLVSTVTELIQLLSNEREYVQRL